MSMGELPMILFTVLSQMAVGAFLVLGVVQTVGSAKFSSRAVDRLADPALLAIGPTLVLGLIASMFHMHDVFNMFNVIRHWQTSWLSREIIFGVGFAALGFLFTFLQIMKIGSARLRQLIAAVTALVGIGLVVSQVMIYYSLPTVPAWNSWATWVQFFGTTIVLGALTVGMAFVLASSRRQARIDRIGTDVQVAAADDPLPASYKQRFQAFLNDRQPMDAATRAEVEDLLRISIRGIVLAAMVAAGVLLIAMPVYVAGLPAAGEAGMASAAHFGGGFAMTRYLMLAAGALLLGVMMFYLAGFGTKRLPALSYVAVAAFFLVLIGEFMGRAMFYESMVAVGI